MGMHCKSVIVSYDFPIIDSIQMPIYVPCSSSIYSIRVFLKMRDPEVSFSHGLIITWMIRGYPHDLGNLHIASGKP